MAFKIQSIDVVCWPSTRDHRVKFTILSKIQLATTFLSLYLSPALYHEEQLHDIYQRIFGIAIAHLTDASRKNHQKVGFLFESSPLPLCKYADNKRTWMYRILRRLTYPESCCRKHSSRRIFFHQLEEHVKIVDCEILAKTFRGWCGLPMPGLLQCCRGKYVATVWVCLNHFGKFLIKRRQRAGQ